MIMLPVQLLVWTVVSAVSLCMILLIIAYLCKIFCCGVPYAYNGPPVTSIITV